MPEESAKTQSSASPYSTGGGGTRLEHRLGALYLVRLLTGGSISELAERVPDRVAFQQSPATTADDLVLSAAAPDGLPTSSPTTRSLVSSEWSIFLQSPGIPVSPIWPTRAVCRSSDANARRIPDERPDPFVTMCRAQAVDQTF